MRRLPDILIAPVVRLALAEDLGRAGDVTASLLPDEPMSVHSSSRNMTFF